MKRILPVLVILGLAASANAVDELLVMSFACARDSFNDSSNPLLNYGEKSNGVWADARRLTLYCDWDEYDLEELGVILASQPPEPYTAWQVRFATTGATWEPAVPDMRVWFGAFDSGNDWNANESCTNYGPDERVGACHLYADDADGAAIPWTLPDGTPVANFWDLPELTNGAAFIGFTPSAGPYDGHTNQCVVDPTLVEKLTHDPYCRGLRCWAESYHSEQVYAHGPWGCPGPSVPCLLVYAVPEPAGLALLAGGAAILASRRRR